jgi:hypothetical protein
MILSFKPQFVKPIVEGNKIHTIRLDPKRRWKPGMKIHFATGVRTKHYCNFKMGVCKSIQKIDMFKGAGYPDLWLDDEYRELHILKQIAKNDGFDSFDDFVEWFFPGHTDSVRRFEGVLIHWTDFIYENLYSNIKP